MSDKIVSSEYMNWLKEIKSKIRSTQVRASLAASKELILFYWDLGESISRKLKENAWGNNLIEQLSNDLQSEFPSIQGFSRTNLYYTKKFYEYFCDFPEGIEIVPRLGGQMECDLSGLSCD